MINSYTSHQAAVKTKKIVIVRTEFQIHIELGRFSNSGVNYPDRGRDNNWLILYERYI